MGGKESLVHTVCACVNISVKFSVKLSGYYQRTRGLGTNTAMSGENTETKIKPHEESANSWFSKDQDVSVKQRRLENNLVPRKGYWTYVDLPNHR